LSDNFVYEIGMQNSPFTYYFFQFILYNS